MMDCPHCNGKLEMNGLGHLRFVVCPTCSGTWATRSNEQDAWDAVKNGETRRPGKKK